MKSPSPGRTVFASWTPRDARRRVLRLGAALFFLSLAFTRSASSQPCGDSRFFFDPAVIYRPTVAMDDMPALGPDSIYPVAHIGVASTGAPPLQSQDWLRPISSPSIVYLPGYLDGLAVGAAPPAVHPCRTGDANGDGKVDELDIVYLTNFIFINGPVPVCSMDMNGDCVVDTKDLLWLVNYVKSGGPGPVHRKCKPVSKRFGKGPTT